MDDCNVPTYSVLPANDAELLVPNEDCVITNDRVIVTVLAEQTVFKVTE